MEAFMYRRKGYERKQNVPEGNVALCIQNGSALLIHKGLIMLFVKIVTCLVNSHSPAVPSQNQPCFSPSSWTCVHPTYPGPTPRAPATGLVLPPRDLLRMSHSSSVCILSQQLAPWMGFLVLFFHIIKDQGSHSNH